MAATTQLPRETSSFYDDAKNSVIDKLRGITFAITTDLMPVITTLASEGSLAQLGLCGFAGSLALVAVGTNQMMDNLSHRPIDKIKGVINLVTGVEGLSVTALGVAGIAAAAAAPSAAIAVGFGFAMSVDDSQHAYRRLGDDFWLADSLEKYAHYAKVLKTNPSNREKIVTLQEKLTSDIATRIKARLLRDGQSEQSIQKIIDSHHNKTADKDAHYSIDLPRVKTALSKLNDEEKKELLDADDNIKHDCESEARDTFVRSVLWGITLAGCVMLCIPGLQIPAMAVLGGALVLLGAHQAFKKIKEFNEKPSNQQTVASTPIIDHYQQQGTPSCLYFNRSGAKEIDHVTDDLEKKHPSIAVITLPATIPRELEAQCHNPQAINQVKELFLQQIRNPKPPQDHDDQLYISPKTRDALFDPVDPNAADLKMAALVDESFKALGINPNETHAQLSKKEQEAVWFHLTQYQLPRFCVDKLQPEKVNFSRDEKLAHDTIKSSYYHQVDAMKQGDKTFSPPDHTQKFDEKDREIMDQALKMQETSVMVQFKKTLQTELTSFNESRKYTPEPKLSDSQDATNATHMKPSP